MISVFILGLFSFGFTQQTDTTVIIEYNDTIVLKYKYDITFDSIENIEYLDYKIRSLEMEMIRLDNSFKYEIMLRNQRMYYYGQYPPCSIFNIFSYKKLYEKYGK